MINKFKIANKLFRSGDYLGSAELYRELIKIETGSINKHIEFNLKLCESKLKKSGPLISVIVPVHNVEEYLPKCLDSILSQSLSNIQLIIVDDGSSDSTLQICEDYVKKDPRILLISNSQASGNSGTPRNQALQRVRGEYIAFVDSDDWIDPKMFEDLYSVARSSKCDIVASGGFFREKYDGTTETVKVSNLEFNILNNDAKDRLKLYESIHFPIVWFRIYRAEFVIKNRIFFGETKTSADLPFAFKALFYANSIKLTDKLYYHYRFDRPGSTIDRRRGKGAFELIHAYSALFDFLRRKDKDAYFVPALVNKMMGDFEYNSRYLGGEFKPTFSSGIGVILSDVYENVRENPIFSPYKKKVMKELMDRHSSDNLDQFNQIISEKQKGKPLITVVMPAHNVENYIERSLKSLLQQTENSMEVIVVNDGSNDNTLNLIRKMQPAFIDAGKDLIIINSSQPSGNPGTPRNIALQKSRGRYIGFLDADDWVEPDMFGALSSEAVTSRADIVSANSFFRHEGEEVKEFKIHYKVISESDQDSRKAFSSEFFSNIWNRIYSSQIVKLNNLYFPEIYLAEDFCFSATAHAFSSKTSLVNKSFYHYNYSRPNSTTDLRTKEKAFQIINDYPKIVNYFETFNIYEDYEEEILLKKINSILYSYKILPEALKSTFRSKAYHLLFNFSESPAYSKINKNDKNLVQNLLINGGY